MQYSVVRTSSGEYGESVYLAVAIQDERAKAIYQAIDEMKKNPPTFLGQKIETFKVDSLPGLFVEPYEDSNDALKAMLNAIMGFELFEGLEEFYTWTKYSDLLVNHYGVYWTSSSKYSSELIDQVVLNLNRIDSTMDTIELEGFGEEANEFLTTAMSMIDKVEPSRKEEVLEALTRLQSQLA